MSRGPQRTRSSAMQTCLDLRGTHLHRALSCIHEHWRRWLTPQTQDIAKPHFSREQRLEPTHCDFDIGHLFVFEIREQFGECLAEEGEECSNLRGKWGKRIFVRSAWDTKFLQKNGSCEFDTGDPDGTIGTLGRSVANVVLTHPLNNLLESQETSNWPTQTADKRRGEVHPISLAIFES